MWPEREILECWSTMVGVSHERQQKIKTVLSQPREKEIKILLRFCFCPSFLTNFRSFCSSWVLCPVCPLGLSDPGYDSETAYLKMCALTRLRWQRQFYTPILAQRHNISTWSPQEKLVKKYIVEMGINCTFWSVAKMGLCLLFSFSSKNDQKLMVSFSILIIFHLDSYKL